MDQGEINKKVDTALAPERRRIIYREAGRIAASVVLLVAILLIGKNARDGIKKDTAHQTANVNRLSKQRSDQKQQEFYNDCLRGNVRAAKDILLADRVDPTGGMARRFRLVDPVTDCRATVRNNNVSVPLTRHDQAVYVRLIGRGETPVVVYRGDRVVIR